MIVIYEDEDLLVVNKPAGLVVNRADSVKVSTLQDWLETSRPAIKLNHFPTDWQQQIPADFNDQYGTPEEIFKLRSGLAHRLDKDTSGALIVAKHPGSLLNLLAQFRLRQTQKKYLALVHGKFALTTGEVNLPIARRRSNRKLFAVVPGGKSALTKYTVDRFYTNFNLDKLEVKQEIKKRFSLYEGFSLVECWPKTGRTHQIRVHLAYLKHPVVGDQFYVGKKRSKLDRLWCPRQFLHAQEIEFTHPRTNERMKLKAELPTDLVMVMGYLG